MAASAEIIAPSNVAEVIDVAALLAPIPGENPSGENTRYSGLHDEIREARRAEDDLVQGDWVREAKTADWPKVESLTVEALAARTKDLQICAWMNESLVKVYGFAGLRDGLKVMRGLHEQFWETVYPENDDGDLEGRANSLSWLDRQIAIVLKEVPITKAPGLPDLNYIDFDDSK
ncbi:MAG TPA: type VI secretion system protein TssA, partial [Pyrinomonadaceae bacterium]|nr:type VI secretion system protein TssA [Pyrinomonadaceae bacterium]